MHSTMVSAAQLQETMARMSYFAGWDKNQLMRLAVGAKQFAVPRKSRMVAKGDHFDALYILISGQVRLFIPLPNGAERVISLVSNGESFGEPCLIQDEPCPYEAVAIKDCHVITIDAMVYRRELRHSPFLAEQALSLVSERFLQTLRDMEICAQPSSLQRVAHYLLNLRPDDEMSEQAIRLPAMKRDIAAKLGLTQETFSRVMAFMAKQEFIQFAGNQVHVGDWQRLHGLAHAGCSMDTEAKT